MSILKDFVFVPNPIGFSINCIIFSATALSLLILLTDFRRLRKKEFPCVVQIPETSHKSSSSLEARRNHLLESIDKESLVAERVENVYLFVSNQGFSRRIMHTDDLYEFEHNRVRARFVWFCGHGLLLLGLLGTFLGFADIASNFKQSLASIDTGNLEGLRTSIVSTVEGLKGSLYGMNTAFGTSICGLIATVVIAVAAIPVERTRQKLLADIDKATEERIIPVLMSPTDETALRDAAAEVGEAVANIGEFLGRAQIIIESLENHFVNVGQSVEAFRQSTDRLLEDRKTVAQALSSLGDSLKAETAEKIEIVSQLTKIAGSVTKSEETISIMHEGMSKEFVEHEKHYDETIELIRGHVSKLDEQLRDTQARQSESANRLREAVNELKTQWKEQSVHDQNLARAVNDFSGASQRLLERVASALAGVDEKLRAGPALDSRMVGERRGFGGVFQRLFRR